MIRPKFIDSAFTAFKSLDPTVVITAILAALFLILGSVLIFSSLKTNELSFLGKIERDFCGIHSDTACSVIQISAGRTAREVIPERHGFRLIPSDTISVRLHNGDVFLWTPDEKIFHGGREVPGVGMIPRNRKRESVLYITALRPKAVSVISRVYAF